ncbi:MAG: hypothetical protein V1926_03265 [Candidatus Peregrinibacteria bacterium]
MELFRWMRGVALKRQRASLSTVDAVAQSIGRCIDQLRGETGSDPEREVLLAFASFLLDGPGTMPPHVPAVVRSALTDIDRIPLAAEATGKGYPDACSAVFERFLALLRISDRNWNGAFYTSSPLADFLVRSADVLLRKIGSAGCADPALTTIDPACGTGHLLTRALQQALQSGSPSGKFCGTEILPLATDVCNLRIASLLGGDSGQCVADARCTAGDALLEIPRLSVRAPVLILCSAPFNQYATCTLRSDSSAAALHASYAAPCARAGLDLHAHTDAYIKFTALYHDLLLRAGAGVAALILRNNWLTSHAHAEMRRLLLKDFDEVSIVDLHGDPYDRLHHSQGRDDENVYGDMVYNVGVCVCFLVRTASGNGTTIIRRADVFGSRAMKWEWLSRESVASIPWKTIAPAEPWYGYA